MNRTLKNMAVALGLVLIGTILTAKASAECFSYLPGHKAALVSPQSWRGAEFGTASLLLASDHHSYDDYRSHEPDRNRASGRAIGPPGGPTQIVEDIILSRDGNHYTGTFTLDAYDTPANGNKFLAHIIGVITATRITVRTSVTSVF
jgi:hypothetical protein